MKPIRLEIAGLNSFRQKQSIEFERLLRDGLFGIFGPTGSGKSSILDAMTLALYGEVKRAPRKHGGVINMREKSCSVAFTFEVGSGADRKRYTVARHLVRTKSDGTETRKVWLREHDGDRQIPIAEKEKEVAEKIAEIVGITLEDFLRAVVLPQGMFAGFLSLKPSDRGDAMQRLFGLNEFGATLSRRLARIASEMQSSRDQAAGRLAELRVYDDNALTVHEAAAQSAAERMKRAVANHEQCARRHEEAAALAELLAERNRLLAENARGGEETMKLRAIRERISLAERSRAVEPTAQALDDARRRRDEAHLAYRKAVAEMAAIEPRLDASRRRCEQAGRAYESDHESLREQLASLGQIRVEKGDLQNTYDRIRTLAAQLRERAEEFGRLQKEHIGQRAELASLDREIVRVEERLRSVAVSVEERERAAALDRTLRRLGEAAAAVERIERESAGLSEKIERERAEVATTSLLQQSNAAGLKRFKEAHERESRRLESLGAERSRLLDLHALAVGGRARLEGSAVESLRREVEEARDRVAQLTADLASARAAETPARVDREEVAGRHRAVAERAAVAMLLPLLHDEEPCPLCGSSDHPFPHRFSDEDRARLLALEQELRIADERAQEVVVRARALEAELAAAGSHVAAREGSLVVARAAVDSALREVNDRLREFHEEITIDSLPALDDYIDQVKRRGGAHKQEIERVAAKLVEFQTMIGEASDAGLELTGKLATLETSLKAGETQRTKLLEELRERTEEHLHAVEDVALLAPDASVEEIRSGLEGMAQREREAEGIGRELDDLRRRFRELTSVFDETERRFNEESREKDRIESEHSRLEAEATRRKQELLTRLHAIVVEREHGVPVEKLIETRRARLDALEREHNASRQEYEQASAAAAVARARIEDCWTVTCREDLEFEACDRRCGASLQEHGFASVQEARAIPWDADELRRLREDAERIETVLQRRAERLAEIEAKIAGRSIGDEALAEIVRALTEADKEKEEATRACGAAQDRLLECRRKNEEWRRLSQENLEFKGRVVTVDRLTKYLRGNAFVNFLANERLDEICRRASAMLRMLTAGRLELGTRPEEGFFIRDNANAGHERATTSLSGGETFLVSLSLALALSDTIQLGRAPLEFFFLDEGFGALDAELLETVMNALERLRSDHRAIGVISHVRQLRERITRRLIVSPPTDTVGTTVEYELA